jgi:hypothetical protein
MVMAALMKDDGFDIRNRQQWPKFMTKGWELKVEWQDCLMSLVPLKDSKEANPIKVAEYDIVANKISEELASAWWVHQVLKRRDCMICKNKSCYWSRTSKYGIELPKAVVEEAYDIDKQIWTDFWCKTIEKEMKILKLLNLMMRIRFQLEIRRSPVMFCCLIS